MRQATLARLRELGFKSYDKYLASDLWEKNKARANLPHKCWICATNRSLHWHHCSYENVGDEQSGDLIVLCEDHHKAVHALNRKGCPLIQAHIRYREILKNPARQKKRRKKKPKAKSLPAPIVKPLRAEPSSVPKEIRRAQNYAWRASEAARKNASRLEAHYEKNGVPPKMTQLERDIIDRVVRTGSLK